MTQAHFAFRWCSVAGCTLGLLGMLVPHFAHAAIPADFGYGRMNVNGKPILGSRPLLVILVNFEGRPRISQPNSFYSNLVFNVSGNAAQFVNGAFAENSNDRFSWSMAGVIGPLELSAAEAMLPGVAFHSNIVARAMLFGFDFQQFNSNQDTNVTQDELQLTSFSSVSSAGARPFDCVHVDGSPVQVCGNIADNFDQWGFSSICHELGHTLGHNADPQVAPIDVYGANNRSYQVTLMSGTIGGTNNEASIWHMDPWHKMQLGWSEPRLVPITIGGVFTLPAVQRRVFNAPLLLYDPGRGTDEFFMLEYRTPAIVINGTPFSGYDRNVASSGMAIWHVRHDQNKLPPIVASEPGLTAEIGWSTCGKCGGLSYAPSNSVSRCRADNGRHKDDDSLHWLVYNTPSDPGEQGWRRCRKCQAPFYNPNQTISVCPAGDQHELATDPGFSYSVRTNAFDTGQEGSWYRCTKCQAMFNTFFQGKSQFTTTCPDGGRHSNAVGTNTTAQYFIHRSDRVMFTLGPPALNRGSSDLWPGDTNTPSLRWLDVSPARTRIHVRPFSPGADEITIEIFAERDTWVDFNYTGTSETGAESTPYRTMGRGVTNAGWGGTVKFKPGSRRETGLITKPLTFVAPLGAVTIGE